ncbi:hypothetical protein EDC96DRAFT_529241 [Choanephora cucurbitarum]|nr:hypothetical protein EDC96DRAFT_529241 [Choanephora cucurbitarum]
MITHNLQKKASSLNSFFFVSFTFFFLENHFWFNEKNSGTLRPLQCPLPSDTPFLIWAMICPLPSGTLPNFLAMIVINNDKQKEDCFD